MITLLFLSKRRKGANEKKRYEQPPPAPHTKQTMNEYAEVRETQHPKTKTQYEGFMMCYTCINKIMYMILLILICLISIKIII